MSSDKTWGTEENASPFVRASWERAGRPSDPPAEWSLTQFDDERITLVIAHRQFRGELREWLRLNDGLCPPAYARLLEAEQQLQVLIDLHMPTVTAQVKMTGEQARICNERHFPVKTPDLWLAFLQTWELVWDASWLRWVTEGYYFDGGGKSLNRQLRLQEDLVRMCRVRKVDVKWVSRADGRAMRVPSSARPAGQAKPEQDPS